MADHFKSVHDHRLKGIKKTGREKCLVGSHSPVILLWSEWFPLINVKKTIHSTEKELDIIDKMTPITTTHVTKTTVMFEVNDFFFGVYSLQVRSRRVVFFFVLSGHCREFSMFLKHCNWRPQCHSNSSKQGCDERPSTCRLFINLEKKHVSYSPLELRTKIHKVPSNGCEKRIILHQTWRNSIESESTFNNSFAWQTS